MGLFFKYRKRNSQAQASKELEAAIKHFPKLPETRCVFEAFNLISRAHS